MSLSISVVIPAHNAGSFIEEAIESVLGQDRAADEIVIVDDGSTDRDYSSLASLAQNIRVIRQSNRGVSSARNMGCESATSQYVALLDADDVWLPGKLRAQMTHLSRHPEVDAVFCRGLGWSPVPGTRTWVRPPDIGNPGISDVEVIQLNYRDFLYDIPIASSTMVVKKSVWQSIGGFDETKRYGEDQDFNLRLAYGHRVDVLKMTGMLYRKHTGNATARIQDQNHWADVISTSLKAMGHVDRHGVKADPSKVMKRIAHLHFVHGYDHFWRGRTEIARREFSLALRKDPLNPTIAAYLLISRIPGLRDLVARRRKSAQPASSDSSSKQAPPARHLENVDRS